MIFKAAELVPLAQKTVATDFNAFDMIRLARLSTEIDRDRVQSLVVDAAYATPFVTNDGADVLMPNRPAIQAAVQQAMVRAASGATSQAATDPVAAAGPPTPEPTAQPISTPTPARVEVLNGTSRNGLAAATADWLRQRGFVVVGVGTADRADYVDTRLLAQPGQENTAGALATALGIPESAIQPMPPGFGAPDVQLILGQSYQLPAR
jgi:hypothetical protein